MYSPPATISVQRCPWTTKPLSCQGFLLDAQQLQKLQTINITIFNHHQYGQDMASTLCSLIGGETQSNFGRIQTTTGNVPIQQSPQPLQYQITAWSAENIDSLSSKLPTREERFQLYKSHAFFIALDMSALQSIEEEIKTCQSWYQEVYRHHLEANKYAQPPRKLFIRLVGMMIHSDTVPAIGTHKFAQLTAQIPQMLPDTIASNVITTPPYSLPISYSNSQIQCNPHLLTPLMHDTFIETLKAQGALIVDPPGKQSGSFAWFRKKK
jgi:hypothetical protein